MNPWIWFAAGIVLLALEPVIPGLVVVFFGLGALLTSGLNFAGLIHTPMEQVVAWLVSSTILTALLRNQVKRIFPALEKKEMSTEAEYIGREVQVVSTVSRSHDNGRVRFQGTTYKAQLVSDGPDLYPGTSVKIAGRDNLVLYVEPAEEQT